MAEESWKKGERRRKFYETNRISLNSFLFKKVKYLADNDPKEFIINQNNQTISDLNIRQKDRRFSYDKNRTSSKIKSVLNFEEEEE